MFFRNLQLYRLPAGWQITADALAEQLARLAFQPCGSQDLLSRGFVSPKRDDKLVHDVGGQFLIALSVETKILPASVVTRFANDRAEDIEAQQGFKPGRMQMKEIKEAVTQELLPRAFTQLRTTFAWIDPVNGFLAIDAPSRSAAEMLTEALHKALDEFPLKLLNTRRSPASAMTGWLVSGEAPGSFTIDQDCELRAVTDDKSAVRYVRHTLEGGDVRDHIQAGKQTTKLALTYDDRVSLVLTDKLEIKRLQFLDMAKESMPDSQSADEQFDADFALMTGELQRLFPALIEALGGEESASA